MLPLLFALTLSLLLSHDTPKQDVVKVKCTAVNFTVDAVVLHCDGFEEDAEILNPDWPKVWHAPLLTAEYNAELRDGKLIPVSTPAPEGLFERIRERTLKEQQRWRIPPTQQSGRP